MKKLILSAILAFSGAVSLQAQVLDWKGLKEHSFGSWGTFRYPESQLETQVDGGRLFVEVVLRGTPELRWQSVDPKELGDLDPSALPFKDVFWPLENGKWRISAFRQTVDGKLERLSEILSSSQSPSHESARAVQAKSEVLGTTDNPLEKGTFYKIRIPNTGVYRITRAQLRAAGLPVDQLDPRNLRIYGNGGLMRPENPADPRYHALQENAIEVTGEQDGIWNDGDVALFYAQGPHGFNTFRNTGGRDANGFTEYREDTSSNVVNIYEDYAYYYLTFDKGPGKRVQSKPAIQDTPELVLTTYDDYQFVNEEKLNLAATGRIWVGDALTQSRTLEFQTPDEIPADTDIRFRTRVAGARAAGNGILLKANNETLRNFRFFATSATAQFYTQSSLLKSKGGKTFKLEYTPDLQANPLGSVFFDYAEIQYQQPLNYSGGTRFYRSYAVQEGFGGVYEFQLSASTAPQRVWEVSDPVNASVPALNREGSTLRWRYQANSLQYNNEFVAFSTENLPEPQFVGRQANLNLHALQDVDYLVISAPQFRAQAQRLMDYHRINSGYRTAMVTPQDIYDEFNSGSQDITALRDFITYVNDRSSTKLKYVLIVGDTSYDYRNRLGKNNIVVPAYQSEFSSDAKTSFVSDDFFVTLSPFRLSTYTYNLPDIPVGRLIAGSVEEARSLVDKTLAYYHDRKVGPKSFGDWQMRLSFAVDDDDTADGNGGGTPFHTLTDKTLREKFEQNSALQEYQLKKIYSDAFQAVSSAGGQRYPQVNQLIENSFSNSNFLMYFGHGGVNGWAQERIFTKEEGDRLNNLNTLFQRFPVVSTVTCDFATWDDPAQSSLGEEVIKNPRGGSALMLASSRAIGVMYGVNYSDAFIKNVFTLEPDDRFETIGEASLRAKRQMGVRLDHQKVNLLGDPAMRISRPARQIEIQSISPQGQLRALDFVTVKGFVKSQNGSVDTSFNGNLSLQLFDKKIRRRTLNNDGNQGVLEFSEEKDPMVRSATRVKNGEFTAEFYLPKDIDFNVGQGRVLVYAENGQKDYFQNQAVTIGGINPNGVQDSQSPVATLYMNNTSFVNGGITDANPTFLACLTDDTGINATGAGLGHDITMYLDGKVIDTRVLNDFYSAGEGNSCTNPQLKDFQKGSVAYPLRGLSPGKHEITFKVWDINNNSTTASLDFVVRDRPTEGLVMDKLLNWPNPFTDRTYIQFEHNCDGPLDALVQIYTVTGQLVRSIRTVVSSEPYLQGYRTDRTAIAWDGTDDFGEVVGKGTYIYQVKIQGQDTGRCRGTAEGVEKLVLLK